MDMNSSGPPSATAPDPEFANPKPELPTSCGENLMGISASDEESRRLEVAATAMVAVVGSCVENSTD